MKIKTLLSSLLLFACLSLAAQNGITVSGTVLDEAGDAVIGAGVVQEGTSNGVITDIDGHYSIHAPLGSRLQFSCVGYKTVLLPVINETLDVTMEFDNTILEETVVIGYGVQKKSDLTGAVSSVKASDLESRGITNISGALQGKSSGIQSYSSSAAPGSTPAIQVRGIASNSSSAPLFVIDGRIAADAGTINPNDIESIEILKDGASAAIYGASAGNGVILITTKRGSGKGTVSYEMQMASQSLGFRPSVMNAQEFANWYTEAGTLTLKTIYDNWDGVSSTDWYDAAFEPSFMQKHNLKFQGGNDKGQFYASLSYLDDNGMVKGDKDVFNAVTGMVNASYRILPSLEVGTNNIIEYTTRKSVSAGGAIDNLFASAIGLSPMVKPVYSFEELTPRMLDVYNHPDLYGAMLTDGNGGYYGFAPYLSTNRTNPLIIRDKEDNLNKGFSLSGTAYATLTPFKWLTVTSRLSYSLSSSDSYSAQHEYFSDSGSGAYRNYLGVGASVAESAYMQWENFATAMHQWKEHRASLMLGTSYSSSRSVFVSGSVTGSAEGNKGYSIDDPLFLYFAYANLDANKSISGGEPSFGRKLAYFGRVNYSYKDKYLLQASLRADATDTSVLPVENRWGFFPAVSAGWVISKEPWMAVTKKWLSQLKLRASWGQNGSLAALGGYMYDSAISKVGQYNFGNEVNYTGAYAPTVTGNKNLKWETSEQVDAGVDAAFFDGRLTIGADWYRKETKDLIITGATLSTIAGFGSSPINAGSILNTGVEMEAGWQDQIGQVRYSVRGNATTLRNRVIKVEDTVSRIPGAGMNIFEANQPAWYMYGYKYTGTNPLNGQPQYEDLNDDGSIGEEDRTYLGSGIPRLSYGLTLSLGWKGFDFTVFGSGVQGVEICNNYEAATQYHTNKLSYFYNDRWTTDNLLGKMPKPGTYDTRFLSSSAMVFDGSYFKIKQIQLGYTLPDSISEKVKMHGVRLYASLENFFTFTKYIGYDPEVAGAGSSCGMDYGMYPNPRKVLFGLTVSF